MNNPELPTNFTSLPVVERLQLLYELGLDEQQILGPNQQPSFGNASSRNGLARRIKDLGGTVPEPEQTPDNPKQGQKRWPLNFFSRD